ncbi:MAG: hypothetical protein HY036_07575 [Nitrospirae bacterium]|nr:hypothetical protein [Nitrospirota bacterium]
MKAETLSQEKPRFDMTRLNPVVRFQHMLDHAKETLGMTIGSENSSGKGCPP